MQSEERTWSESVLGVHELRFAKYGNFEYPYCSNWGANQVRELWTNCLALGSVEIGPPAWNFK
jgi:hypothetical protein